MILHLLPEDDKLFIPKFIKYLIKHSNIKNNILMCYDRDITIMDMSIPFVSQFNIINAIKEKKINRVIIHSLQPNVYSLLKEIINKSPQCKLDWIYWGETFDDPTLLLGRRSLIQYLNTRRIPKFLSLFIEYSSVAKIYYTFKNKVYRHKLSPIINKINTFYHWSLIDYNNIKNIYKLNKLNYNNFIYDIFEFQNNGTYSIENNLKCNPSNCIVVGHSSSLRNNHLEVLPSVVKFAIKTNKTIILPFSYGGSNKIYTQNIIKYLTKIPNLKYKIIENYYPEDQYSYFLSKCGAYIAPGRGSIGAGNMIKYLFSSGIPIVSSGNTVGEFLKQINAKILIYNKISEISYMLNEYFGARYDKNKSIVENYFSSYNRQKWFDNLLSSA